MKRRTSMLAILGAKWLSVGVGTQKVFQGLVVIILARILVPSDFGLVAIAVLTMSIVNRIQMMGMSSALIQRKKNVREAANVFFYMNCVAAVILYAGIFSSSPLIARFFGNPEAHSILRIAGLQVFLEGSCVVQRTLAIKELQFKRQTLLTLCNSFLSGIISIVLALAGYGVWSLVLGPLAGVTLESCLWWLLSEWHPSLSFDRKVAKEILAFGSQMFVTSTLDSATASCNRIFIGRFLGVAPLGFYDLASRTINLPCQNIITIGQQVSLPAFCQVQEDTELVKRWYLKMTEYSFLLLCPIVASLLVLGDLFVPVIFGSKWEPAIPLIRILALYALMMPLVYTWSLYVSTGKTNLLLRFTLTRFVVTTLLLLYAARISLIAVCIAEVIGICIFALVNLSIVMRQMSICRNELFGAIRAPLTSGAVFALILLASRWGITKIYPRGDFLALMAIAVPAFACYLASFYFYGRETFVEIKNMIWTSLGSKTETAAANDN